MAGLMYLGNQMVSPVIVYNIYNVTGADWLGYVDENGKMQAPNSDLNFVFKGVVDISDDLFKNKFQKNSRVKSVSFPDLKYLTGTSALYFAFGFSYEVTNSNIESVSFPELESVSGADALNNCFSGQDKLTSIAFPKLKTVTGSRSFNEFISYCSNVNSISFPELETVSGSSAFYYFGLKSGVKNVEFPKLTSISNGSFDSAFYWSDVESVSFPLLREIIGGSTLGGTFSINENLSQALFPSLETINGDYAFSGAFNGCNLTEFTFNKLSTISGTKPLSYVFSENPLTTLSFPALTLNSFDGTDNTCFQNMLSGCNGTTVHFPADVEDIIGDWSDTLAGFGGTNITILYDYNPCYVAINVEGTSDYEIYVNGKEKTSPFTTGSSDKQYCVYDNTNYRVFFGMLENLVVGETTTFTANVANATDKVMLATGINDLDIKVFYKGNQIPLTNDGSGNYYFYTNGSGNEFSYTIEETATTRASSGTITTIGSDLTVSAAPEPKSWIAFTRPNLTSDGTMGGDKFAVTSSGTYSTSANYQAYRAVDGNTANTYYWYSTNITNPIYYFYNPSGLKVSSLDFRWTTTSYRATQVVVAGSNDNSTWSNIGTYALSSATTVTATLNSQTDYKYFRLTFTKGGTYIRMVELGINATIYG